MPLVLWGIQKKQTAQPPWLIKFKSDRGKGPVSPASDQRRLIKYWTRVAIIEAEGKERGHGRLESLAMAFKWKLGLHRILISGEN